MYLPYLLLMSLETMLYKYTDSTHICRHNCLGAYRLAASRLAAGLIEHHGEEPLSQLVLLAGRDFSFLCRHVAVQGSCATLRLVLNYISFKKKMCRYLTPLR